MSGDVNEWPAELVEAVARVWMGLFPEQRIGDADYSAVEEMLTAAVEWRDDEAGDPVLVKWGAYKRAIDGIVALTRRAEAAERERAAAEEACREEIARYDECFKANTRLARRVAELEAALRGLLDWLRDEALFSVVVASKPYMDARSVLDGAAYCSLCERPGALTHMRTCSHPECPIVAALGVQETEGTP